MISGFPLDYMHAVCLSVVRKILFLLLKGPLEIRLGRQTINKMSQRLIAFSHQVPLEFGRKPCLLSRLPGALESHRATAVLVVCGNVLSAWTSG